MSEEKGQTFVRENRSYVCQGKRVIRLSEERVIRLSKEKGQGKMINELSLGKCKRNINLLH